jgi:chromosomal replication initiator protein
MTLERHISVWNNCLRFIQQNIDPKQFNVWFRPIRPVSLVESTLTVEVPSEFFREYLEDAYLDMLKAALKKELGVSAKLLYQVTPVKQQPSMTYPAAHACRAGSERRWR